MINEHIEKTAGSGMFRLIKFILALCLNHRSQRKRIKKGIVCNATHNLIIYLKLMINMGKIADRYNQIFKTPNNFLK